VVILEKAMLEYWKGENQDIYEKDRSEWPKKRTVGVTGFVTTRTTRYEQRRFFNTPRRFAPVLDDWRCQVDWG
jgi:hypothetical protein